MGQTREEEGKELVRETRETAGTGEPLIVVRKDRREGSWM